MNLSNWREEYDKYSLHEENLTLDPYAIFKEWFDKAVEDLNPEPNAFILSTVSAKIEPESRVVRKDRIYLHTLKRLCYFSFLLAKGKYE